MTRLRRSRAIVAPPQIVVVRHFDEELKRLVPKMALPRMDGRPYVVVSSASTVPVMLS